MMSKYLKEKENFLKKATYKKVLLLSKFKGTYANSIQAEEKLNSLSNMPFVSSVNSIIKFVKNFSDIDLIECGDVEIKNLEQLKMLCDGRKIICILKPNANLLGFTFKMRVWISLEKTMQILSELLNKEINYYVINKKETVCYIH